MLRLIMSFEDMLMLGLDPDGDIIKDTNGVDIFVISDLHASSIMKEKRRISNGIAIYGHYISKYKA